MLIRMLDRSLNNLPRNKIGFVVEVNHAVNLRRIRLGAADRAFFVDFVDENVNSLADFGLQSGR